MKVLSRDVDHVGKTVNPRILVLGVLVEAAQEVAECGGALNAMCESDIPLSYRVEALLDPDCVVSPSGRINVQIGIEGRSASERIANRWAMHAGRYLVSMLYEYLMGKQLEPGPDRDSAPE